MEQPEADVHRDPQLSHHTQPPTGAKGEQKQQQQQQEKEEEEVVEDGEGEAERRRELAEEEMAQAGQPQRLEEEDPDQPHEEDMGGEEPDHELPDENALDRQRRQPPGVRDEPASLELWSTHSVEFNVVFFFLLPFLLTEMSTKQHSACSLHYLGSL